MSIICSAKNKDIDFHHTYDKKPNPADFVMHTHPEYELYYFISGEGVFYVEGNKYPLSHGDLLFMRCAESHYISINKNHPYERCAIRFSPSLLNNFDGGEKLCKIFEERRMGFGNILHKNDFIGSNYNIYLKNILNCNGDALTVTVNLFPLLMEMTAAFENKSAFDKTGTLPVTHQITEYINSNLNEPLSLDSICEEFFISKSQLCRIFKNSTGSTVWDYITVKRLNAARELLKKGVAPTKVFSMCGFSDYSIFYRAYKRQYGVTPKQIQKPN